MSSWDPVIQWTGFVASLAVISAIYFLVRQMRLAQITLEEERRERSEQRERQRTDTLNELAAAVGNVEAILNKDLSAVRQESPPQTKTRLKSGEEVVSSLRFFIWTPLPRVVVEQAIRDMSILGLTTAEARDLQELVRRILKANNLVHAKLALFPALGTAAGENAEKKIDDIDRLIIDQASDILDVCSDVRTWLKARTSSVLFPPN